MQNKSSVRPSFLARQKRQTTRKERLTRQHLATLVFNFLQSSVTSSIASLQIQTENCNPVFTQNSTSPLTREGQSVLSPFSRYKRSQVHTVQQVEPSSLCSPGREQHMIPGTCTPKGCTVTKEDDKKKKMDDVRSSQPCLASRLGADAGLAIVGLRHVLCSQFPSPPPVACGVCGLPARPYFPRCSADAGTPDAEVGGRTNKQQTQVQQQQWPFFQNRMYMPAFPFALHLQLPRG